jgi:ABC-type transport system involved in multi-copper enzyme maturation permease subunit
MSWVTWRQHRLEGVWVALLGGLLALTIAYVAREVDLGNCSGPGQQICLPDDAAGQIAQAIVRFNLFTYALVVFPALAGAFIGAPLVAREVEQGTHRLVWTQGLTRVRWFVTKVVLVLLPLLTVAGLVGMLEVVLLNVESAQVNRWAFFDQQAPVTVAATFLAFAFGVAAGAVVGRSIPAMAVTLLAFVIVRIGIAELARPSYMAPVQYRSSDFSNILGPGTSWWLGGPEFHDAAGHVLSNMTRASVSEQAAYFVVYYQPGDRFWIFQSIESAILGGLAILVLAFAMYWVVRRVA